MGARPLSRLIDNEIKSPLSRQILFGELVDGGQVSVSVSEDKLCFNMIPGPIPLTKLEKRQQKSKIKESAAVDDTKENQTEIL